MSSAALLSLQDLLAKVISQNALKPSRIGPMRTAVKQFSAILEADPAHCWPPTYHLTDAQVRRVIATHAPQRLGGDALRNLKNNIVFLLHTGVELGLLDPPERVLPSPREAPPISSPFVIHRQDRAAPIPSGLRELPPALAAEFAQYSAWCLAPYVSDRPASLRKLPVTLNNVRRQLMRIAGFLVVQHGRDPAQLTLRDLTTPELLDAYASWWIAQRGKVTRTIRLLLMNARVIAQYWLHDDVASAKIHQLIRRIGDPGGTHDKRLRWLSMVELEHCGLARYPVNAQRWLKDGARMPTDGTILALRVAYSLMLRLLVRIPLRQRNIREMSLHRNLKPPRNGTRQLEYRGEELKIPKRRGEITHLIYTFPADLHGLLEEWLIHWRPRLLQGPDHGAVFINLNGQPFSSRDVHRAITCTTWKFAGVAVNPHTIRDIWATEYINATRDIAGAAYMLGNTVEVVLKHYAHLLDAEAERRATQWLQTLISHEG